MLLDLATADSFDINGKQISQAKYYAFFAQDNYRVMKTSRSTSAFTTSATLAGCARPSGRHRRT